MTGGKIFSGVLGFSDHDSDIQNAEGCEEGKEQSITPDFREEFSFAEF